MEESSNKLRNTSTSLVKLSSVFVVLSFSSFFRWASQSQISNLRWVFYVPHLIECCSNQYLINFVLCSSPVENSPNSSQQHFYNNNKNFGVSC